ncbi:MAG: ATP-binding cassette domain-containing protein [Pseudomonadota bacterium]
MLGRQRKNLAGNLSGGEQQVLEMAMVLLTEPSLLLLDEPSLGLSPKTQSEVFDTVRAVAAAGVTILMVEQNVRGALAGVGQRDRARSRAQVPRGAGARRDGRSAHPPGLSRRHDLDRGRRRRSAAA